MWNVLISEFEGNAQIEWITKMMDNQEPILSLMALMDENSKVVDVDELIAL